MCSYRIIMTSVLFCLSSENMKKADAEDSDGQFFKKKSCYYIMFLESSNFLGGPTTLLLLLLLLDFLCEIL